MMIRATLILSALWMTCRAEEVLWTQPGVVGNLRVAIDKNNLAYELRVGNISFVSEPDQPRLFCAGAWHSASSGEPRNYVYTYTR